MALTTIIKVEGITHSKIYYQIEGITHSKIYNQWEHWEGHPENLLKWLISFNKDFCKKRPDDNEYKLAQLLRSSVRDAEQFSLDNQKYTGWGLVSYNANCGESFEYTLKDNGNVTVRRVQNLIS
jgi:hypothetical protein